MSTFQYAKQVLVDILNLHNLYWLHYTLQQHVSSLLRCLFQKLMQKRRVVGRFVPSIRVEF
jgi:hypothetical protein